MKSDSIPFNKQVKQTYYGYYVKDCKKIQIEPVPYYAFNLEVYTNNRKLLRK